MHYKILPKFIATMAAIFVVLSPGVVAAQSEPTDVTEVYQAASTETVVEETTTLEGIENTNSESAVKSEIQAVDKAVAGEDTVDLDATMKLPEIFLPLVGAGNISVDAAEVQAYWRTLRYEGFEGIWPGSGWRTYDCNGTTGGTRYWDDESYKPYVGSWSAWPAGSALNPRYYYYPNNACAWMIYGPFSLRYALSARLWFKYWNQSERYFDWVGWYVSCNNTNFYGVRTSGDSAGWRTVNYNLSRCLGDSTVWIGYKFTSDGSIVDDGPFVDHIYVQEYR